VDFRDGTKDDLAVAASWVRDAAGARLWAGPRVTWPLEIDRLARQVDFDQATNVAGRDADGLLAFGQSLRGEPARCHLCRVIVRPDARGRGAGRALVAELLRGARAAGCARAGLNVYRDNPGAVALYRALGFRPAEPPAGHRSDPASWYMELELGADPASGAAADELLDYVRDVTVGAIEQTAIVLVEHDPAWAARFAAHKAGLRAALGERALLVEHIGSTAVPGLPAKPIVDVLLVVADSADEPAYLPALKAAGYELRIREPEFHEHRMLRTPGRDLHLHVLSAGSPEIERYLLLRDRLRREPGERVLYEQTKRALAAREWPTMSHYADAKGAVIEDIIARARAAATGR
jgi:GrpB-like predicted nucleotidyltransferase (UPF0157 family)/ribosomal protein S18 acetylase RimI-like enzyme